MAAMTKASTATGFRTHNCNELRASDVGKEVTLCGWVQTSRDMNHFAFVDLRDRQCPPRGGCPGSSGREPAGRGAFPWRILRRRV